MSNTEQQTEFYIGQIFEETYPPEAAVWCNEGQVAYIDEIETINDVRRFEIKKIPQPTEEEKAAANTEAIHNQAKSILNETTYLIAPDVPATMSDQGTMLQYRQYLYGLLQTESFDSTYKLLTYDEWKAQQE